ncbi:orange carotenoid protein N-terminal domain-containing protein [Lyngbya aestuarii]|uniref:orange carotenoid protein N-terminal domain-containing protein n=1 Tax=Lyngbya aestuarii TaxID=118322 RepID=UPI00403D6FA6
MSFANYQSFNPTLNQTKAVPNTVAAFKRLNGDEQLGLLWLIYEYLDRGGWSTIASPGVARLQLTGGLLDQIKAMSHTKQSQVMRDLLNQADTPITRAYGILSNNNKLAFWYQLAGLVGSGEFVPVPPDYQLSPAAAEVFDKIALLDFGRQIQVLRQVMLTMGIDPLAV